MAVLDSERYEEVIKFGKQAITFLKENDMENFLLFANKGWDCFPEPKNNWNQAYNYSKMIYRHFFNNKDLVKSKIWLNKMIDVNNVLQFENDEVLFETAKYQFEIKEYENSLKNFEEVVKEASFRYFENEDPKYLDLIKNPEKYIKK